MKFISFSFILLAHMALCATEYAPWFDPPFEFQGRAGYLYQHSNAIQSPLGNFDEKTRDSSVHLALGVTPWPNWNIEIETFLTHTTDISFAYESTWLTARYAWLDDVAGDPLSFVTGVTCCFPTSHFLQEIY